MEKSKEREGYRDADATYKLFFDYTRLYTPSNTWFCSFTRYGA